MKLGMLCLLAALAAAGCASQREPLDTGDISRTDKMAPGPGLFSGKDGAFRVEM
jgi:hypothetical protein